DARAAAGQDLMGTFAIRRGQQYRVASYEMSGTAAMPRAEFEPALRVKEGQPFSDARLDADIATIEELYHRRGFTSARAQSAVEVMTRTPPPAQVPGAVRIVVNEGVRATVDAVPFTGNQAIDEAALRSRVRLLPARGFGP